MHGARTDFVQLLERTRPVPTVGVLPTPFRKIRLLSVPIDVGRVSRVTDHHCLAALNFDQNALMADGVARGRHHPYATGDLRISVEQLEPRAGEVEPLGGELLLFSGTSQLRSLDVERGVLEDRVLAAMVEMQVAVDHNLHISRAQIVVCKGVGSVPVDHFPFLYERGRPSHSGINKDRTRSGMLDHESMNRNVIESVNPPEVQSDDLQDQRKGETAKIAKSSAT